MSHVIGQNKTNSAPMRLSGAALIAIGALFALVPLYIFPVCDLGGQDIQSRLAGPRMPMACYYTARAEAGLGLAICLMGLPLFFCRSLSWARGLASATLSLSLLAAAIPSFLIGVCPGPRMPCHSGTLPALLILSGALFLFSLSLLLKKERYRKESS